MRSNISYWHCFNKYYEDFERYLFNCRSYYVMYNTYEGVNIEKCEWFSSEYTSELSGFRVRVRDTIIPTKYVIGFAKAIYYDIPNNLSMHRYSKDTINAKYYYENGTYIFYAPNRYTYSFQNRTSCHIYIRSIKSNKLNKLNKDDDFKLEDVEYYYKLY